MGVAVVICRARRSCIGRADTAGYRPQGDLPSSCSSYIVKDCWVVHYIRYAMCYVPVLGLASTLVRISHRILFYFKLYRLSILRPACSAIQTPNGVLDLALALFRSYRLSKQAGESQVPRTVVTWPHHTVLIAIRGFFLEYLQHLLVANQ